MDQNIYIQVFHMGCSCCVSALQIKNICKIAHNQPTLRCKWAFDGVEGLDKNKSCSNQGVTKQVLDAVVAAFQIYDRHISSFLVSET